MKIEMSEFERKFYLKGVRDGSYETYLHLAAEFKMWGRNASILNINAMDFSVKLSGEMEKKLYEPTDKASIS